jgi:hypothetical protein
MFIPNREELAWAGGFYTGEGTVGCNYRNNTRLGNNEGICIRMSIKQVEREPLVKFRNAISRIGSIVGPNKRPLHQSPIHQWRISSYEGTQAILAMLWPWLSTVKKEQARKAFVEYHEYRSTKTNFRYMALRRADIHEAVVCLYKSGHSASDIVRKTGIAMTTAYRILRKTDNQVHDLASRLEADHAAE